MSNSTNSIIAAVVMFGAAAAGTYTGRVIPTPAATTPAAVTTTAPATTSETKPEEQPINEQNGLVMPGLSAADYYAAVVACDTLNSPTVNTTNAKIKARMDLKESLYIAAVKAVGAKPETCGDL